MSRWYHIGASNAGWEGALVSAQSDQEANAIAQSYVHIRGLVVGWWAICYVRHRTQCDNS